MLKNSETQKKRNGEGKERERRKEYREKERHRKKILRIRHNSQSHSRKLVVLENEKAGNSGKDSLRATMIPLMD